MKKLLVAMALGAALAWLFDSDNGSRRRAMVSKKLDDAGLTRTAPITTPRPVAGATPVTGSGDVADLPKVATIP